MKSWNILNGVPFNTNISKWEPLYNYGNGLNNPAVTDREDGHFDYWSINPDFAVEQIMPVCLIFGNEYET